MRVTIEFTTTGRLLSRMIRKLQRHGASHVRIKYETIEPVVLEAIIPVVIERPCNDCGIVIKSYTFQVSTENIIEARRKIGRWYDAGNLIMLGAYLCLKWIGVSWRGWKSNPHQDICTDIALTVLGWSGHEKTTIDGLIDKIDTNIRSGELVELSG